jgi:hypothetical protein
MRLTCERIAELEELLQSDRLIPSQGVSSYQSSSRGQGSGNPTLGAVVVFEREAEHYVAELKRLKLRKISLSQDIRDITDRNAGVSRALCMLSVDMRTVVEGKYRFQRSLLQLSIELQCDESTVRYHLTHALQAIEHSLEWFDASSTVSVDRAAVVVL